MFKYSEAAKRYRELNPTADSISFIKYTTGMNQDKFDDILIGMAINDDVFIKKSLDILDNYSASYLLKFYLPTRITFDPEVIDFLCRKSIKEGKFFPYMPFKAWFNSRMFTWKEKLESYNKNVDIFRKIGSRTINMNLNAFKSGLSARVDMFQRIADILNGPVPEHLSIDSLNELAIEMAIIDPGFPTSKEIQYKMMKDALHVDFPYDEDLLKMACCNDDYIKDEQFLELLVKYGKEMISQIYLRSRIDFKFLNYLG